MLLPLMQNAINAYLQLDGDSQKRLRKIEGKVMTIELKPLNFIFQLQAQETKISLHSGETLTSNAKITGTPLQLCGVALSKQNRQAFFAEDVHIEGDAEFANEVIALFDELDIDWEEHCSKLIGDVGAHQLGRTLKKFRHWLVAARDSFTQDVSDYVHEELSLFPPGEALQDFYSEIDQLRMAVDRLEARVALL